MLRIWILLAVSIIFLFTACNCCLDYKFLFQTRQIGHLIIREYVCTALKEQRDLVQCMNRPLRTNRHTFLSSCRHSEDVLLFDNKAMGAMERSLCFVSISLLPIAEYHWLLFDRSRESSTSLGNWSQQLSKCLLSQASCCRVPQPHWISICKSLPKQLGAVKNPYWKLQQESRAPHWCAKGHIPKSQCVWEISAQRELLCLSLDFKIDFLRTN